MKLFNKLFWPVMAFLIGLFVGYMLWGSPRAVSAKEDKKITCYKENPGIDCMENEYKAKDGCPGGWTLGTCPAPVDCEYHYGECSVSCGGGTQEVVVDKEAEHLGKSCPTVGPACNEQACEDGGDDTPVIPTEPVFVAVPLTQAGAPMCQGFTPATIPWAYAKRVSPTSYMIFYVPTVVGGQANIRYMEQGAKEWQHALRDYPNVGVAPLGFLKENVKYNFQISNGEGCNQSAWSAVFKGI